MKKSYEYYYVFESIRGLHCAWLVLRAKASSNDVDGFRLWMVDPLERGCSIIKGSAQLVVCLTLHHALHWDGHLVENQEGLEAKVGLKAELVSAPRPIAWLYVKRMRLILKSSACN